MKVEPREAYVYQPMPPQEDGRYYGVGGLSSFNVDPDIRLVGISKIDAEMIAHWCNKHPAKAEDFILTVKDAIDNDWRPECGCRFEGLFSNAVLLCDECAQLPCHNLERQQEAGE